MVLQSKVLAALPQELEFSFQHSTMGNSQQLSVTPIAKVQMLFSVYVSTHTDGIPTYLGTIHITKNKNHHFSEEIYTN